MRHQLITKLLELVKESHDRRPQISNYLDDPDTVLGRAYGRGDGYYCLYGNQDGNGQSGWHHGDIILIMMGNGKGSGQFQGAPNGDGLSARSG